MWNKVYIQMFLCVIQNICDCKISPILAADADGYLYRMIMSRHGNDLRIDVSVMRRMWIHFTALMFYLLLA